MVKVKVKVRVKGQSTSEGEGGLQECDSMISVAFFLRTCIFTQETEDFVTQPPMPVDFVSDHVS